MKVLIIGSGGREHALALKISESSMLEKLFVLPGNPGTSEIGINVSINPSNHKDVINFCKENKIDLIIIGPEAPLVAGLTDELILNGFKVFGPNKKGSLIEGDKIFAKQIMKKYQVPTAEFVSFNSIQKNDALNYIKNCKIPIVVKASGLAAGKGVAVCESLEDAEKAIIDCFDNKIFGESGDNIVIEECLFGEEASIFAICDGNDFITLPSAQDHKRIFDGDKGKNTGGMGAYSPAPIVTDEILKQVEERIIRPTLDGLRKEGIEYIGCLYCGLMITDEGPKVIEFNCRFGDPETQAVLPIVKGDFLDLLYSAASGKINKNSVSYQGGSAVCVIAASLGYPDTFEKGFEIFGLNKNYGDDIIIYHSGTKKYEDKIITNGGRVLGITAISQTNNLKKCKERAYEVLSEVSFQGVYFRKDIADKAINKL